MNAKEHALRLAVGAHRMGIPFELFIEGLNRYVHDSKAIDKEPLLGWWNFGGPDTRPRGISIVHQYMIDIARLEPRQRNKR